MEEGFSAVKQKITPIATPQIRKMHGPLSPSKSAPAFRVHTFAATPIHSLCI